MTRPIHAVSDLANGVASCSLDEGMPAESDDELGRLSKAIHEMSLQLGNKIEEISREKDYLQTLLSRIMEGVLVVDTRGRILMVNHALRQLLSLPSHVEDRTPLEIIRNAELEGALRQVLRGGGNTTLELCLPFFILHCPRDSEECPDVIARSVAMKQSQDEGNCLTSFAMIGFSMSAGPKDR